MCDCVCEQLAQTLSQTAICADCKSNDLPNHHDATLIITIFNPVYI